jgi:hypothetical protein|uniref:Uncharacterized protein n=1 Tax=Siphoviridae sp. ctwQT14 TaxID=2827971 RepID=A0A8S5TKL6_9CAUD|nr:MAG TPA: hypothetical protein [Siphoviridae sp. ctwQT14]
MTTRSLTAVKINGEYKIAQYGYYDGYPSGQGVTILKFLLGEMDKNKFIKKLKKLRFVINDQEERERIERQYDYDGAKILKYIQNNEDYIVANNLEFAQDTAFCQWAYLIDFDDNSFEIYSGLKKANCINNSSIKKGFENLNLLKKYKLNALPNVNELINVFQFC